MRIICFGSINMDLVYEVPHIAVGGETILSTSRNVFWGGKGLNQAVAVAKSSDQVYMAGIVNRNEEHVLQYMEKNDIHTDYIRFSDTPTGHAVIYVDRTGQNSITVFGGSNQEFTEEYIRATLKNFEAGDIVLLQNETNGLSWIIEQAYAKGIHVALNPSPFNETILKLPLEKVRYFLYNEIEAEQIAGQSLCDGMIDILAEKYPQAVHVLTLGKKGVICKSNGKTYRHGIYDVPVVDTTAAGDTFTGFFLSSLSKDEDVAKALEVASKASSIAVSRNGATASIPNEQEVAAFTAKLIN